MTIEVADLIIKVKADGAAAASAQLAEVGHSADAAGTQAQGSAVDWEGLHVAMSGTGDQAIRTGTDLLMMGKDADIAAGGWDSLGRSMTETMGAGAKAAIGLHISAQQADDIMRSLGTDAAAASGGVNLLGERARNTALGLEASSISAHALSDIVKGDLLSATTAGSIGMGRYTDAIQENTRAQIANAATAVAAGGANGGGAVATDVGALFAGGANVAGGLLATLGLVIPVVNVIIAGIVGILSLLAAGAIAGAAFAAAFIGVGAAMVGAALKWRDLLTQTSAGASKFRADILAVEASAYNAFKSVIATVSQGTGNLWNQLAKGLITVIQTMTPYIARFVGWVTSFVKSLSGGVGPQSPFLTWLKTWVAEFKVLGGIIHQGIPNTGGFFGFLTKYQEPAKAFVEGIAQVINAVLKLQGMGLGLNMTQTAEFIKNVFTAFSSLIQIVPKLSNALVGVGLEASRAINQLMPIVKVAFDIGAALLTNIVQPIVNGVIRAFVWLERNPILRWLTELGGGLAVAAKGVSLLSFGTLKFGAIMSGQAFKPIVNFVKTLWTMVAALRAGDTAMVLAGLKASGFGKALLWLGGILAGAFPALGALGVALVALVTGTGSFAAVGAAALAAVPEILAIGVIIGEVYVIVKQFTEAWTALHNEMRATSDLLFTGTAAAVSTAASNIVNLNAVTNTGLEQLVRFRMLAAGTGDEAAGATQGIKLAVGQLNSAFLAGNISADVYASSMRALGQSVGSANGALIQLQKLTAEGAANTIAQSLLQMNAAIIKGGGSLAGFAKATGQDFTQLKQSASSAIQGITQGLVGSGADLTKFLTDQKNAITTWKQQTADSFNFVKNAWQGLASQAHVTFAQIKKTLDQGVVDAQNYAKNWDALKKLGASKELLRQIQALGIGGAQVIAGLVSGGKAGVAAINADVKRGASLATTQANDMAKTLGVTMQKVVAAIELMVSQSMHIPIDQVKARVANLVHGVNQETAKVKPMNIKVNFTPAQQSVMAHAHGGRLSNADTHNTVKFSNPFPPPDTAAIKSQWVPAGKAMSDGAVQGLQDSKAAVPNATQALAASAIKAARMALGAQSPSKEFAKIGVDCIDGLVQGLKKRAQGLTSVMQAIGKNVIAGLQAGMASAMPGLLAWLGGQLTAIKKQIHNAMKINSPSQFMFEVGTSMMTGMKNGLAHGFRGVQTQVKTLTDHLQKVFGDLGHVASGGTMKPLQLHVIHGALAQGKGATHHTVKGRLSFDWQHGAADLEGAMDWKARNTA